MLRDKDIREPLFEYLEDSYGRVRIIEEKTMGRSRADVMMVTTDSLYGIEIKSDADTYVRLARQVKDYNRFFDYNIVCVGSSHASHVCEHIPEWWGIISVEKTESGGFDFYVVREPLPNPKREKDVKFRNQLSMLWRLELAHIQEINGMHKYAAKSKDFVVRKLMSDIDRDLLKRQLCAELFERDYNTIAERIEEYKKNKKSKKDKKNEQESIG